MGYLVLVVVVGYFLFTQRRKSKVILSIEAVLKDYIGKDVSFKLLSKSVKDRTITVKNIMTGTEYTGSLGGDIKGSFNNIPDIFRLKMCKEMSGPITIGMAITFDPV